jgi:hypothetical protein
LWSYPPAPPGCGSPDAFAQPAWPPEVEGSPLHWSEHAGGNEVAVDRRERIGVHHELVSEHVAGSLARQVEVGVLGQVDRGGTVGPGAVLDAEHIRVGDRVGNPHLEVAGIALVAVRAGMF